MSATLYRKYRSRTFSEIVGQQHIVQTLANAIKNNRIGHAYLFTGPRGTGKTTMARLFAKAINCQKRDGSEPCLKCEICKNISENRSLDIIEIDAASHTGVENIRELRETVKLPPTQAKYKVYIIDEAHMLSSGAFNALLKTLEEPPAHAIFILATTAIHKIPETILSRCQRFDFSRLPMEGIIKKLSFIAKNEGVKIDKNSLELIALAAEGGMRDAESLLSQIMALENKNITSKEVEEILGTADRQTVEEIVNALVKKDISLALSLVNKLSEGGYDLDVFSKSLLNYLRQLMLVSIDPDLSKNFSFELTPEQIKKLKDLSKQSTTAEILKIIDSISEGQNKIKSSFIPQLPLEIAIIKSLDNNQETVNEEQEDNPTKNTPTPKNKVVTKEAQAPIKSENVSPVEESVEQKPTPRKAEKPSINIGVGLVKDNWNKLLEDIKPHNHSLSALLSNCQPISVSGNIVSIVAKYSFYKDKMCERQNKLTIEDVLGNILNSEVRIKVLSEEEAGIKIEPIKPAIDTGKSKKNGSLLNDAMSIMGGKIVE